MANETMAMTGPQQKVIEHLTKHGEVEAGHLKKFGLDLRAANNLVKLQVLTLTGGVYRLRDHKKAKAPKAKAAEGEAAPESAVVPVVERAEAAIETAELAGEEAAQAAVSEPAAQAIEPIQEAEEASAAPELAAAEPEVPAEPEAAAEPEVPAEAAEPTTVKEGPGAPEVASAPELAVAEPTEAATPAEPAKATAEPAKPSKPAKAPKAPKPPKAPKAPKPAKVAIVVNPTGECLCGCGMQIGEKKRFVIGHDARLHSLALRVHRGKIDKSVLPTTEATRDYLRGAPWMTDEIRASLSL